MRKTILSILLLIIFITPSFANDNPITITSDLNKDGQPDNIIFTCDPPRYKLQINNSSFNGDGNCLDSATSKVIGINMIDIIDIDKSDSFLEIAVPDEGPSDDYSTHLFYYDGQNIHFLGSIQGFIHFLDGNGRIYTKVRGKILHTWYYPKVYKIDDNRKIQAIDQEIYLMNTECMMKRPLALRASRNDTTIVSILQPGDRVTIIASDDIQWCLVCSPHKACGWFQVAKDGFKILDLGIDANEVFEGISAAD